MIGSHYEVGSSGRGTRIMIGRTEDLFALGSTLPPGKYWITQVRHPGKGGAAFAPIDWGTIEVFETGRWKLSGPGGLQVGPGYAVV